MRVVRARNLILGLSLLLTTGCTSGGFSTASMPSWWPWGKKTPASPETGLADNGYPQSPAQQAQQGQVSPSYGPPSYGYPQTDPALAYGNPTYGNPTYGNTAASYTGAPSAPAGQYAAAPGYSGTGLYDPNAAAAYAQQGYGAAPGAQPYPAADPSANVALQNQYYNPDYARTAQPATTDPAAAAYGYPAAGAPAYGAANGYSDPNYASAQPTAAYPASAYPSTGAPADPSAAAASPYGGAAAYTADTRTGMPAATQGAPEVPAQGAYPAYAPEATTINGSAWSNTTVPGAQPTDPTMTPAPGHTGYTPGSNGYQPSGVPAYQSPAPMYQSNPNAGAPASGASSGTRSATPYRPGSTGDYRSSGAATFRAATPAGEYVPSAGVAPASYEAASAPEAPATP
ncbi:MAG: hypothetical protein K2Y37_18630 [Pirellulales bacterium]|nr:hypothetical protein [Pirellulales bacterium]